ncbi:hypothetical protein BDW62DRAFT_42770 [Aspergillus aurantiobrunneus]
MVVCSKLLALAACDCGSPVLLQPASTFSPAPLHHHCYHHHYLIEASKTRDSLLSRLIHPPGWYHASKPARGQISRVGCNNDDEGTEISLSYGCPCLPIYRCGKGNG